MRGCCGTVEYEAGKEKITHYKKLDYTILHKWLDDGEVQQLVLKM